MSRGGQQAETNHCMSYAFKRATDWEPGRVDLVSLRGLRSERRRRASRRTCHFDRMLLAAPVVSMPVTRNAVEARAGMFEERQQIGEGEMGVSVKESSLNDRRTAWADSLAPRLDVLLRTRPPRPHVLRPVTRRRSDPRRLHPRRPCQVPSRFARAPSPPLSSSLCLKLYFVLFC